ncbi:MAG TPA: lysylphosphatidylglycerol synthase domain-containing protein [Candidatus Saccharimonadales bacterium]|nr:lysylphosphatidylglycerol synthase domain-containing protein [Candidatus Saccharimonadales bacterium]
MVNKKFKLYVAVIMPLATILACSIYLKAHRSVIARLMHTSPQVVISVFLMYVLMIGILVVILDATLRICSKRLDNQENAALNSYTLLANFFLPGQSGPAIRGAYLYKKHKLKVKNFIAVTLLYYVFYGSIGIIMLVLGSKSWKLTVLSTLIMVCAIALAIYLYLSYSKVKRSELNLSPANIIYLVLATVMQSVIQAVIYGIELHNGNHHIAIDQIITYTGAANLALFVALTPGAIGIRESFLLSTEKLHHISSNSIVVANIIDRSVYLVFLMAIGVYLLISSLHSKNAVINKIVPNRFKLTRSVANEPGAN